MGCDPHLRNTGRDTNPPPPSDRLACSQHPWQMSDLPLLKEIPWLPKEPISAFYCSHRKNIFPHIQPKSSLWQVKEITACPTHCGHKDRLVIVLLKRTFELFEGCYYNPTPSSLFFQRSQKPTSFIPTSQVTVSVAFFFSIFASLLWPLANVTIFFSPKKKKDRTQDSSWDLRNEQCRIISSSV